MFLICFKFVEIRFKFVLNSFNSLHFGRMMTSWIHSEFDWPLHTSKSTEIHLRSWLKFYLGYVLLLLSWWSIKRYHKRKIPRLGTDRDVCIVSKCTRFSCFFFYFVHNQTVKHITYAHEKWVLTVIWNISKISRYDYSRTATEMDGTLHTDFRKFETSRHMKEYF